VVRTKPRSVSQKPVSQKPVSQKPVSQKPVSQKPVSQGSASQRQKAARIQLILDTLYPTVEIPLAHVDPFTLLVAVVLSAQTTDKKVNQVTPALFAVAPTPEAMARLSVAEIAVLIREVGLAPQKAKALRGLAEKLVAEHGSRVPSSFDELVALPGVGRKTANVVLSQAFGQPAFPVDTHIHRLAARWGLSRGRTPDHTELDLRRAFPEASWNKLHLQMIYFGREHCPALYHDLADCPICGWAATKARAASERLTRTLRKTARAARAAHASALVARAARPRRERLESPTGARAGRPGQAKKVRRAKKVAG
jgi:endonuclease III